MMWWIAVTVAWLIAGAFILALLRVGRKDD